MKKNILTVLPCVLMVVLMMQQPASAHAFPDHCEPKVGATVNKPPHEVKIWFSGEIEGDFSAIEVFNAAGAQIDKKDSHLDPKDKTLLIVSVPDLAPGTYKVVWHVVAADTHKTKGDYKFEVKQ